MTITVKAKHIRIAPRKVRLVADMIRGEKVQKAKSLLSFTVNKSAMPILKLLNSGTANAKNDFSWEESNLYISKIIVDEGPKLKRWMPRARGSASPIQKKTSHITIDLNEIEESGKSIPKKKSKVNAKSISLPEEIKKEVGAKGKKEIKDRDDRVEKSKFASGPKTASRIFRRKSI